MRVRADLRQRWRSWIVLGVSFALLAAATVARAIGVTRRPLCVAIARPAS
jgi:hypothetical protein